MADIKISALPTATTPLTGAELVPVVQGGVTKQTTTSDVLAVPITSLTASSAVATDASKKLVSVANTGTGDNVLANGPTLVAPALGTPASGNLLNAIGLPIATGVSGLGTGVATALAISVGTAGSPVVNGGALGTPSSGTLTSATGLPISTGVSGLGTGVATALAVNVGTAGSPVVNGGALGTPSSGTVTNLTGTANITATGGASGAIAATTLSASGAVSGAGFSAYLASPPAIGGTTPAAVSATSLTDSGNLTFTGTGNRITGDFSNATVASRVMFQTSTANSTTWVSVLPNGTSTDSRLSVYSNSDPTNTARLTLSATSSSVAINSAIEGTGTYVPLAFATGGAERVRVDTSGNVGVGKTPVAGRGVLQVNGDVEMTSQNTGQLAGLRNRVINGGMGVNQRGSVTPVLGTLTSYTIDRWGSYQTGAAIAISQGAGNGTDQPYALTFSGIASNTEVTMFQPIESINCYDLAQTGFTFSVWLYATVAKTLTFEFATPTTTKDVFSATTNLPSGVTTFSHPGTGWVKTSFSYSAANAIANATAIQRGLRVLVRYPSCSSGSFGLTGVQLEIGSVATPFEQRPYGMELALCQRYYYRIYPGAVNKALNSFGAGYSTTFSLCLITFPVTMRITPTALEQSGVANQYSVYQAGTGEIVCTAVPTYQPSTTQASAGIGLTVASGLAQFAFQYAQTNSTNGANAYLGWSAEL